MKALLSLLFLAGAITLAATAIDQRIGSNIVLAQSSSACIQNCVNVRKWPEAQCRQYCRGKPKKPATQPQTTK